MSVVMLTGASGFLGIHILQRLLDQGQQVRAFVRTPAKLRQNLASLGVDPDDPGIQVVRGDMTDAGAVKEAVSGCDQAVHAAATFSYRRQDAERMIRENHIGTSTVLDAAIDAGCGGIVHVSSIVALLRPGATLDRQSPPGVVIGPYTQSKVESERTARERQQAGAPVAIVYPGGVLGPTTRTSARATSSSVTSSAAEFPYGHEAKCSGWTYETPRRWWSPRSRGLGGAIWFRARASRPRTRRFAR